MSRGIVMRRVLVVLITFAAGPMLPAATSAQTVQPPGVQTRTTHIVEFDLPAIADASPGAMIVDSQGQDNSRIWFVTGLTDGPNVNNGIAVPKLCPRKILMKG